MSSVDDIKAGKKIQNEAIEWLAGENAGEIMEDVDMDRKKILDILKNILIKEGIERKFHIVKLEKAIRDAFKESEGD